MTAEHVLLAVERSGAVSVEESHTEAVRRALAFMRANLPEPHGLADYARVASLSPYHFHRVFSRTTGVTPGRFMTALRLAEAKRLLLGTTMNATSIGMSVGYLSTGAFTAQFNRLVGLTPGRFRIVARALSGASVADVLVDCQALDGAADRPVAIHIDSRPDRKAGSVVLAAFPTGMPQGRPTTCAVVETGTTGDLAGVGAAHYVLGFSLPSQTSLRQALTANADTRGLYVGRIDLASGEPSMSVPVPAMHFPLRAVTPFDPPLLTALPLLRCPPSMHYMDAS